MAVSQEELIEFYDKASKDWWEKDSAQKIHHVLYDLTYPYIRSKIINKSVNAGTSFEDLQVLDVGCGGGILTEMLARDGASATGIDINKKLIDVAKAHARLDSTIYTRLSYFAEPVEEHAKMNEAKYDAIFINFVLVYVVDREYFLKSCVKCLKPGGYIFVTAENKSWLSWLYCICLLQKVLRAFSEEYGKWDKFMPLEKLNSMFEKNGCKVEDVRGIYYNYWKDRYYWLPTTSFDYLICARKC